MKRKVKKENFTTPEQKVFLVELQRVMNMAQDKMSGPHSRKMRKIGLRKMKWTLAYQ